MENISKKKEVSPIDMRKQEDYWNKVFNGEIPALNLPVDYPRPHIQNFDADGINFTIGKDLTGKLNTVAEEIASSMHIMLFAAYNVLLSRYTGQEDIVVGLPIAGECCSDTAHRTKLFNNIFALRNFPVQSKTFKEFLQEVEVNTLKAFENKDYSLEELASKPVLPTVMDKSVPFETMFIINNTVINEEEYENKEKFRIKPSEFRNRIYKCDIILEAVNVDGNVSITIEYCTKLFKRQTIERLAGHFTNILTQISERPEIKLSQIQLLSEDERKQILYGFNNTAAEYPIDITIHELFREQAEKLPDNIAVVFEDSQLTYRELNERSDRLAGILREKGVKPDSIVAIMTEQCVEMIIGIIGILKAGGAYLPVDPRQPDLRIKYILQDSGAVLLLTQSKLYADKMPLATEILCLDKLELHKGDCVNIDCVNKASDLAYVIYTSGSTGTPKGVMVEHRALVNLCWWHIRYHNVVQDDRSSKYAGFGFDASVLEIFPYLISGASIHIVNEEYRFDVDKLNNYFEKNNITISFLPTPMYEQFMKVSNNTLRKLITGGDKLNHYIKNRYELVNIYGPTENTVVTTSYIVTDDCNNIPIGKPIPNTQVYILDKNNNLQPVGIPGELCIAGDGLARGYLNRPELTEKMFAANPFVHNKRMYRTGDMARWRSDGNIEFLGRIDHQVKINGYRIELGEIEQQLNMIAGVTASVVNVWNADSHKMLVAYYTTDRDIECDLLKKQLSEVLPEYMIPAFFVCVEHMPLNSNGKVDRKVLPPPTENFHQNLDQTMPTNEIEQKLKNIWSELLRQEDIGIYSDFFSIGGDSILVIEAVSKARENGIFITPKQLVENPTIAALAGIATSYEINPANTKKRIKPYVANGEFGLTPIQKWFVEENFEEPNYFNQSQMILVEKLDFQKLQMVVNKLVKRHHAFGLRIINRDGEYYQYYNKNYTQITVKCFELSDTNDSEAEIINICESLEKQLDYILGPTIAVGVIYGHTDGMDRLFITVHHMIIDSVSWRILLKDLYELYNEKELLPVSATLDEWHHALLEYAGMERTFSQLTYWQKLIKQIERFNLPTDFNNDDSMYAKTEELFFSLDKNNTETLKNKCTKIYNTKVGNLILAAWALSLGRWSKCSTIAFKMEGHGREICVPDVDVTSTIGWFTSVFPVCLRIPATGSIKNIIKAITEQVMEIPDNGLSYGVLRYCHADENVMNSLKMDSHSISFNYLGQFDSFKNNERTWASFSSNTGQDRSSPENHGMNILELNCSIVDNILNIYIKYSVKHFKNATIQNFSNLFLSNIKSFINSSSGFVEYNELKYPLSPLQKGLLFHYVQNPKSDQYFVQVVLDINGILDMDRYHMAWQQIFDENEAMRTYFIWEGLEEPLQCVADNVSIPWTVIDISSLSAAEQQEKLEGIKKDDRKEQFLLGKAPLSRITIVRQSRTQWRLILSCHHIILDGMSIDLLLRNVHQLYSGSMDIANSYKERVQHGEYISWILNKDKAEGMSFWKDMLSTLEYSTDIPSRLPGAVLDIHKSIKRQQEEFLIIGEEQFQKYRCFAKENHITLNTLIQFAWSKLLHAYNREDTTVSGIVVSGRAVELYGTGSAIGMFINTVPIVIRWDSAKTAAHHLFELHKSIQDANIYSYISLNEMKSVSNIKSQAIFYSIVTFENYIDEWTESLEQINIRRVEVEEKTNYPITISVRYRKDEFEIRIFYDEDCFESQSIRYMLRHMQNIIDFIIRFPMCNINDIDIIDGDEFHTTVKLLDNSACAYPTHKTIVGLFEEQVRKNPDNIAVTYQGDTITYQQLDERATSLAIMLENKGVGPGMPVGICINRSLYMIIGILGTLKAGGAYVPIDPDYPGERIRYMLEDSGATIVLTEKGLKDSLANLCGCILIALDDEHLYDCHCGNNKEIILKSSDPAYIIYTSGTTGMPKGVVIEHRNVVSLLFNEKFQFDFSSRDIWTLFHSVCFDFSVWEIFGALLYGGKLVIVPKEAAMDTQLFHKLLIDNKVTVLNQTPQAFYNLMTVEQNSTVSSLQLRYVIFGGETLSPDRLKPFNDRYKNTRLINMYGITETTVFVTYKELTEGDLQHGISNIGKPIPTLKAYIMDRYMKELPVGVPGELCVGGAGVGRGYINRTELTAEKFVSNPYNPSERLYRSGDLVRLLYSGDIEYLERIDKQVKIRGFRVELGEIESVIRNFTGVKDCVVLVHEDKSQNKTLAAYVKAKSLEGLGEYLKDRLPFYMIPAYYIQLNEIPLTVNKKVDRSALPLPETVINTHSGYEAPRNAIEQTLAEVMQHVLGITRIGIRDSFFILGGHSLNALNVVSLLQKEGIHLTVSQIFKEQTIENLSRLVLPDDGTSSSFISNGIRDRHLMELPDGGFPLSAVQRRFFKRELVNRNVFNVPYICLLKKYFSIETIKSALVELIKRHDALRLTFGQTEDGAWYQYYRDTQPDDVLLYVDLNLQQEIHDSYITQFSSQVQNQFNIAGGALFKIIVFDHYHNENKQVIVMLFHHLTFDGMSLNLFLQEFKKLVCLDTDMNTELDDSSEKLSYTDWCREHVNYAVSNDFSDARHYWHGVMDGGQSLWPDLHSEVQPTHKNMATIKRVILEGRGKVMLLKEKSTSKRTTNVGVLLSALWMACRDVNGQCDILLHLMSCQRESFLPHVSIQDTIGFFAGAYPIRLKTLSDSEDICTAEIVETVRENLYGVPKEGLDYFVLKYLLPDIVEGTEPLNDPTHMLFHFVSQETDFVSDDLFQYMSVPIGNTNSPDNQSNYLLNITAVLREEQLQLTCYYSRLHYRPETIIKLFDSFDNRLNEILYNEERNYEDENL